MPKFNERNALRNNIVHFKTEKSYVSADIRW
ncbi:gliding motility-associated C-terminal domain-containing protein, partial [Bacteroides intestinalis]